jgi:hypothetical protein
VIVEELDLGILYIVRLCANYSVAFTTVNPTEAIEIHTVTLDDCPWLSKIYKG